MIDMYNPDETFHVAGLNVTRADLEELQTELDRITEAEKQAVRQSRTIIIGNNALQSVNQGEQDG